MKSNLDYLRVVPLFSDLKDQSLVHLANQCARKTLAKEEILFLEGESGDALYIVIRGKLRIERISEEGLAQTLGVRGPGEVVGEMAILENIPRTAQVTAATEARLLTLQRSGFENLILTEPQAALAIMKSLSRRLRESANMLLSYRSKTTSGRLLEVLKGQAEDGLVSVTQSQAALSERVGCTREAVNRGFRQLVEEGKIEKVGNHLYRIR